MSPGPLGRVSSSVAAASSSAVTLTVIGPQVAGTHLPPKPKTTLTFISAKAGAVSSKAMSTVSPRSMPGTIPSAVKRG